MELRNADSCEEVITERSKRSFAPLNWHSLRDAPSTKPIRSILHPEAAQQRRNLVLKEMLDMKTISNKQYEAAVNTPVTDGLQSLSSSSSYPAYMDNYPKEVIEQVEEERATICLTTGMDVYTNVDTEAQKKLWDIYNTDEYVNYPDDEMQVASTVIDVNTGKVIAQLGSRHQSSNVSFGTKPSG